MKKNVTICDKCEVTIATKQCDICGKDLCEDCSNVENNAIVGGLMELITCEGCDDQLDDMMIKRKDLLPSVFKEKVELKKEIIEVLKNAMMLNQIEEEKNPMPALKKVRAGPSGLFKFNPNPMSPVKFNPNPMSPVRYDWMEKFKNKKK